MYTNRSVVMALFSLGVLTAVGTAQAPSGTTGAAPRPSLRAATIAANVGPAAQQPVAATTQRPAPNSVTGATVVDGSLSRADLGDAPRIGASATAGEVAVPNGATVVVREVIVTVPAAGRILAFASGTFFVKASGDATRCGISNTSELQPPGVQVSVGVNNLPAVPFATTSSFVASPGTVTIKLLCRAAIGSATVFEPSLTTIFVAGS